VHLHSWPGNSHAATFGTITAEKRYLHFDQLKFRGSITEVRMEKQTLGDIDFYHGLK
jgi:hypothetical protein